MRRRWLARALIVVGVATSVAAGVGATQAASADEGITVQGATLPTTAGPRTNTTTCDLTGGPYQDHDVWAFAAASGAHLDVLTASFTEPDGASVDWRLSDGDQTLDLAGHSVAWLRTPAGWTLTAARAEAGAGAGQLLFVGACAAGPAALAAPNQAVARPAAPAPAATTLPVTGEDVGGMLAVGLGLVIGGGLLLTVRRRRPTPAAVPGPRDDAHVWTYPDR